MSTENWKLTMRGQTPTREIVFRKNIQLIIILHPRFAPFVRRRLCTLAVTVNQFFTETNRSTEEGERLSRRLGRWIVDRLIGWGNGHARQRARVRGTNGERREGGARTHITKSVIGRRVRILRERRSLIVGSRKMRRAFIAFAAVISL